MSTVAQITDATRTAAAALVSREEQHTGSRMAAYETVAAMTGVSPSWLRKFIGRSHDTTLSIAALLNIKHQYDRVCSRIEADAERMAAQTRASKAKFDAATSSALEMDHRVAREPKMESPPDAKGK